MKDLLKGFSLKLGFGESPRNFMSNHRTVVIKYTNGKVIEKAFITEPWKYIAKVKKNIKVEDAWIKSE